MNDNEKKAWELGPHLPEIDHITKRPIDVLDYWTKNANAYPTVAMMARDLFAVPVSTVPSESCFSSANRILTDKRTKLGAKRFEQLVCLKDWIEAEIRMEPTPTNVQASASASNIPTQECGTSSRSSPPDDDDVCDGAYDDIEWWLHRRNQNF